MHDNRRTRVLLAVLLVVALLIITVDYSDSTAAPVRALRSLGSAVFGGAEAATATVVRPFADLFGEDGGQPGKVRSTGTTWWTGRTRASRTGTTRSGMRGRSTFSR